MAGGLTPPANVGGTAPAEGTQRSVIAAAAAMWGISPKTLWGVYGTESGFGTNLGPSSAGAEGPFQFMPATAKQYSVDVTSFSSSAYGAAHYLHDLGADGNPTSAATKNALNRYNGNGGGSSDTSYTQSVTTNGDKWTSTAPVTAAVTGVVDTALSPLEALGKVGAALLNPNTYFRLGKGALGGTLLILGTGALTFMVANKVAKSPAGQTAIKAASVVAK